MNNQELTKQQLIENKKNAIDEYDKSTVNDGYFVLHLNLYYFY